MKKKKRVVGGSGMSPKSENKLFTFLILVFIGMLVFHAGALLPTALVLSSPFVVLWLVYKCIPNIEYED